MREGEGESTRLTPVSLLSLRTDDTCHTREPARCSRSISSAQQKPHKITHSTHTVLTSHCGELDPLTTQYLKTHLAA